MPEHISSVRTRTVIAVLIALTSVLGAFVAWRASVADGEASGAETKGFADLVAAERARSDILANLDITYFDFLRAEAFAELSEELAAAKGNASGTVASQLDLDSRSYDGLRNILLAGVTTDAIGPGGSLLLDRAFELNWDLAQREQDLDYATDFDLADEAQTKAERLVGITALLVAAALFFTLAEVSKTLTYRAYLAGGTLVLVASVLLFFVVEVA